MHPISEEKQQIRENTWKKLKARNLERFPYAWGRIPNFKGAKEAAQRLVNLKEFKSAYTVFVAPDSPQRPVREKVLVSKKQLVMPTPRLKSGFLLVLPVKGKEKKASSIKGAFKFGKKMPSSSIPEIDLVVQGAVAVDFVGGRLGKGGGYGDREIEILREHKKISKARIAVTVHDVQLVRKLPQQEWDFTVDIIVTPSQVVRTEHTKKEAVSKYMSYLLRHHPPQTMSEQGFIPIDQLVTLVREKYNANREFITLLVEEDSKGRFEIKNERIRALYGHSFPVSIALPPADVDILYHGTTKKAAACILKEGLKSKGRQKVHLSPTLDVAREVGERKCETPVLLQVDVTRALEYTAVRKASALVYVADFIPPQCISLVE